MHQSIKIILITGMLIAGMTAAEQQPVLAAAVVIPSPIDKEWHFRVQERTWADLMTNSPRPAKPQSWAERLQNSPFRWSLGIDLKSLQSQSCTIQDAVPWHELLTRFAGDNGQVWRLRGTEIEFLPTSLAKKLSKTLDGTTAPRGTKDEVLGWFAASSSLRIHQHASLGKTADVHLRFAPRTATVEEWLVGIGYALHAAILIQPAGDVVLYHQPESNNPVPLIPVVAPDVQSLTYYVGPPTALDREVTFRFDRKPFADSIQDLQAKLGFPIEIDDALSRENLSAVTLQVERMKIRDVLNWVRMLGFGDLPTKIEVLADRVRIVADTPKAAQ
jgi:hypothetical protein